MSSDTVAILGTDQKDKERCECKWEVQLMLHTDMEGALAILSMANMAHPLLPILSALLTTFRLYP